MHTLLGLTSVFRSFFKPIGGTAHQCVGLIGLLLLPTALPAAGQPNAAFPGEGTAPTYNLRVYPTDFWGPRVGPGVGVGVVGHNLTRRHDQWLLTVGPALHEQVGTLSFASANPTRARRYVLADTRVLHSDREWIGPWRLHRSAVRTRLRVGQMLLNDHLLVQPHVVALFSTVSDVQRRDDRSVPPASRPRTTDYTGLRTGLDLRLDTRTRANRSARGLRLQGTWDRYLPVDGTGLQFDQIDLDLYGTLPIWDLHRLQLRTSMTLTRNRADVPIPPYMRPTLSGTVVPGRTRGRFLGNDRLLGSLLYRFPLYQIGQLGAVEGHLGAHLANVYTDLGTEFTSAIRFDDRAADNSPLRPSASVGLRLAMPFRHRSSAELALGVSPDGVSAVRVSFTRRLQALRFPHHTADPLR